MPATSTTSAPDLDTRLKERGSSDSELHHIDSELGSSAPRATTFTPRFGVGAELSYKAQRAYVSLMLDVLGRLLAAGSLTDPVIQAELSGFPEGYSIAFSVLGERAGVRVARKGSRFVLQARDGTRPDLQIIFKHLTHAFALLSFRESTPRAFANGRLVTDGDVALTMRFVRCLDRVQAVILPDPIAARALKSLPQIAFGLRLKVAASMTSGLVFSYFRRTS
jgi:hypothetical protein